MITSFQYNLMLQTICHSSLVLKDGQSKTKRLYETAEINLAITLGDKNFTFSVQVIISEVEFGIKAKVDIPYMSAKS